MIARLVDLNATEAASRAGYGRNKRSSGVLAAKLRRKSHVAEAIAALIAERSGTTQSRVIRAKA